MHISAERDRAGAGGTGWAQPKWGERAHRCAVHRFFVSCGACGRPEPAPPRGKLLRIVSPLARRRGTMAAEKKKTQNKKARILSESGPLCEKEWEGARLRASSARWSVVIALQTSKPCLHGAHERMPARDGAVVQGGDAGFHDGSLLFQS